jgi:hypothetical protein
MALFLVDTLFSGNFKKPAVTAASGSGSGKRARSDSRSSSVTLIKKKRKFSSNIRKFRMEQLQSHI